MKVQYGNRYPIRKGSLMTDKLVPVMTDNGHQLQIRLSARVVKALEHFGLDSSKLKDVPPVMCNVCDAPIIDENNMTIHHTSVPVHYHNACYSQKYTSANMDDEEEYDDL